MKIRYIQILSILINSSIIKKFIRLLFSIILTIKKIGIINLSIDRLKFMIISILRDSR